MWLGDVLLYTLKNVFQLFFLKKSNSQSDIWSSPRLARERKMKDPCRSGSTVGCVCVWERKFSFWKVVISQVSKESRRSGQPSFFPISFFYQKNHVRLIFMINPPGPEPKNLFLASKLFTNNFSLTFLCRVIHRYWNKVVFCFQGVAVKWEKFDFDHLPRVLIWLGCVFCS